MNCKAGDLAIVKRGEYAGKIVHILYLAPRIVFKLPDGHEHEAWDLSENGWVIKSAGMPFKADCKTHKRLTMFVCGRDGGLIPIKGDELKNIDKKELELNS